MLSIEEALVLVESHVLLHLHHEVPLEDAVGLVLAQDIASDIDSPQHDKAMMDGYAMRGADRTRSGKSWKKSRPV